MKLLKGLKLRRQINRLLRILYFSWRDIKERWANKKKTKRLEKEDYWLFINGDELNAVVQSASDGRAAIGSLCWCNGSFFIITPNHEHISEARWAEIEQDVQELASDILKCHQSFEWQPKSRILSIDLGSK